MGATISSTINLLSEVNVTNSETIRNDEYLKAYNDLKRVIFDNLIDSSNIGKLYRVTKLNDTDNPINPKYSKGRLPIYPIYSIWFTIGSYMDYFSDGADNILMTYDLKPGFKFINLTGNYYTNYYDKDKNIKKDIYFINIPLIQKIYDFLENYYWVKEKKIKIRNSIKYVHAGNILRNTRDLKDTIGCENGIRNPAHGANRFIIDELMEALILGGINNEWQTSNGIVGVYFNNIITKGTFRYQPEECTVLDVFQKHMFENPIHEFFYANDELYYN
jgi:hypothetical protein